MRPPITQRCPKAIFLRHIFKKTEFYFEGLDLHYRAPEIGFQVVNLKRTTLETLNGSQFEQK